MSTNIFTEKNVSSFCIFFSKNTCELDILLTRTFNILTTNMLIKLTMLWTTGPWSSIEPLRPAKVVVLVLVVLCVDMCLFAAGPFLYLVLFIALLWSSIDCLVGEEETGCFSLTCGMCTVCHGLFALPSVSMVGYILWFWLCLDTFCTIFVVFASIPILSVCWFCINTYLVSLFVCVEVLQPSQPKWGHVERS